MKIIIKQVSNDTDVAAVEQIHEWVFEREMGIKLAPLAAMNDKCIAHFLARCGPKQELVGSLSVTDTSEDHQLHESFKMKFGPRARVARYVHLAVLKPYRGLNVPLALMLEAQRRLIAPRQFDYTWLLFNAERAAKSFLSRLLGFTPLAETYFSEYGCRRPLVRDERAPRAVQMIRQAEEYLWQFQNSTALIKTAHARPTASA